MEHEPQFAFTAELSQAHLMTTMRRAARRLFWIARILGLLTALYGGVLMWADQAGIVAVLFFVALGAAVAVGLPALKLRMSLRRAQERLAGPITFRVDDEGVHSATRLSDGLIRWPLITRVEELPGLLLLWLGKSPVIPVPVDQLPPETRAALVAFVRAHLAGQAPAPRAGSTPEIRPSTPR